MKVIKRHYVGVNKQYGFCTWTSGSYRAFDFFWGKHLFVLGFDWSK